MCDTPHCVDMRLGLHQTAQHSKATQLLQQMTCQFTISRIAAFVFKLYSLSTHTFDVKLLIGVNVLHADC